MADFDLSLVVHGVDDGASATGQKVASSLDNVAKAERGAAAGASQYAREAQMAARTAVGLGGAALVSGGHMARMGNSVQNARIAMMDMTHVGINMGTMLASGVNPMRALVMESGRLATAIQYSQGGIKGLVGSMVGWLGIIKATQDAEATAAATSARASAERIAGSVRTATANIEAADTEFALAEAQVRGAASADALTAAQARLAKAHQSVAAAAAEATVAEDALATAEARSAEATKVAAASRVVAITPVGIALGVATVAAVGLAAALSSIKNSTSDAEMKKFAGTLGLTSKEMKKLKDVSVTWGDTFNGLLDTIGQKTGVTAKDISSAFGNAWKKVGDFAWAAAGAMVGAVTGLHRAVDAVSHNIEVALGGGFAKGANLAIEALNFLFAKATDGFNSIIGLMNTAFGTHLATNNPWKIEQYKGDDKGGFVDPVAAAKSGYAAGVASVDGFRKAWEGNTAKDAKARVSKQADDIIGNRGPGPKGKKGPKAKDPFGLDEFGRDAEDKIRSLAEGFVEIPSQVEKVNKALRSLDDLVDDIAHKKPPNMKELLADAERARTLIQDGLNKPFNDFVLEQQRSLDIARLTAQGRDDEAEALGIIQKLEREQGPLDEAHKDQVLATVQAIKEQARQTEILKQKQQKYMDLVASVKSAFQDVFTEGFKGLADLPKKLISAVAQLKAAKLFEGLFGDSFRDLEDQASGVKHADDAAERMSVAVDAATAANDRAKAALDSLTSAANGASTALAGVDPLAPLPEGATPGVPGVPGIPGKNPPVVVTGKRPTDLPSILERLAKGVGISDDAAKSIGKNVGNAVGGAATGALTNSFLKPLGKMLGFKTSQTGAEIGGAIGGLTGIPGADIIGSILGSIVGGLFKKVPKGSTTITDVYSPGATTGNNAGAKDAAKSLAASVQGGLLQIAESLGGTLGSFAVSVGTRHGDIRVDPSGHGATKISSGAVDFNQDQAAAIAYAIMDAIADGAVKGLSPAVQRALQSSPDLDQALREALKVQQVEDLIGGIGGQLARMFKNFDTEAADRVRVAKAYGLDVVAVERINGEQRAKLLDDILKQQLGSLQDLQKSMLYGDLFEGDAGTRRTALLDEITKVTKDAEAGVDGATDQLANLYQQLIGTSKEAYGTAGPEYSADRDLVTTGLDHIIETERDRIQAAADYQTSSLALTNETNDLLSGVNGRLDTLIGLGGGHSSSGGGGGGGRNGGNAGTDSGWGGGLQTVRVSTL